MDTSTCPDRPHVHPCVAPMLMFRGHAVVLDNNPAQPAVALVFDETVAERIANLLARHGLVDVPDSLAPAWPAPTGPAAVLDAPQPTGPA